MHRAILVIGVLICFVGGPASSCWAEEGLKEGKILRVGLVCYINNAEYGEVFLQEVHERMLVEIKDYYRDCVELSIERESGAQFIDQFEQFHEVFMEKYLNQKDLDILLFLKKAEKGISLYGFNRAGNMLDFSLPANRYFKKFLPDLTSGKYLEFINGLSGVLINNKVL